VTSKARRSVEVVASKVPPGVVMSVRNATTPDAYVDPDNFREAVQALMAARHRLLLAADQADWASRLAGTPIRTGEVRAKIELLSNEIRRIEAQISDAAYSESLARGAGGGAAAGFVRTLSGRNGGGQVGFGFDEPEGGAARLAERFGGHLAGPGGFGRSRRVRGYSPNDPFRRLGGQFGFGRSSSLGIGSAPSSLALTSDAAEVKLLAERVKELEAKSDAELKALGVRELDRLALALINVKDDARMSKGELKLALRLARASGAASPELHLAALAAGNVKALRALADHEGFAHELRDQTKALSDQQLKALSSKELAGLAGILVRAGDDSELTGKDLDQILRVLVAFNSTQRSADDALSIIDISIGPKLLEALAFSAIKVDYANGKYEETPLALELRKLAGRASFAPAFSSSELAKLVEKGNAEVAGFLFAGGGIAYSKPMLELGFKRFVLRDGELNDEQTGFLLIDPPGFRVLVALASIPAAASGIMFDDKSFDQAWSDYKKLLDGPDRLSQRRKWNSNENKWKLEGGGANDKETDLAAALFLSAATKGYAATHTAAGEGKYLYDILTKAVTEQGKYKLTDGGRVALASLLTQTMAHPDYTIKFLMTIAKGASSLGSDLSKVKILGYVSELSKSRTAANEIMAGFGGFLSRIDITEPSNDFANALNSGLVLKRMVNAANIGLEMRAGENLARDQKAALFAIVLVSLATGGLGAVAAAAGTTLGAVGSVAAAGAGDGIMTYISGIPQSTFESIQAEELVMFEFQQRILRSAAIGIEELKLDGRVLKHLNQDGTLKTPKPEDFRKMMQDINDAFCSRDPKDEQLYRYKNPALVLDKALIGWHADMSQ
jgi:hypothetical protein